MIRNHWLLGYGVNVESRMCLRDMRLRRRAERARVVSRDLIRDSRPDLQARRIDSRPAEVAGRLPGQLAAALLEAGSMVRLEDDRAPPYAYCVSRWGEGGVAGLRRGALLRYGLRRK